jgi:sugar/nucleoside kinase (ribokinase family)
MAQERIEVVHVGAACRDIALDDPRGWRLGGGVTYAALTTARLGLTTAAVIGVDAEASEAHELRVLRAAGVDMVLVPLQHGPVFRNVETPAGRAQTVLSISDPIQPLPLPTSWLATTAWSFVPVADEVPDAWAEVAAPDAIVAVGWQGMLRTLEAGAPVRPRPPASRALLRRADLIGVSRHDVPATTSVADLVALARPGAQILITRGSEGGLLAVVGEEGLREALRYLPSRSDGEVDPTGAGDTFLAALVAATVRPRLLGPRGGRAAALRFAAAAGSLAVERTGLLGVPDHGAVMVRRARERVRRTLLPSEAAQVG